MDSTTHNPLISLIAAIDDKHGLGKNNRLLFKIPEDQKWYLGKTRNHVNIMGRKTLEAMRKPIPHRTNIVITRDQNYKVEGAIVVHSLKQALEKAKKIVAAPSYGANRDEIFVIGGGEIYKQALPFADKLYLTKVKGDYGADTFFPPFDEFKKVEFEEHHESNGYDFTFYILTK